MGHQQMYYTGIFIFIMDGMGSQFDPGLERYYVSARPELEAYYTNEKE